MTLVVPFTLTRQTGNAFFGLKLGTFDFGIDVLGYSLMRLSTLFAAKETVRFSRGGDFMGTFVA
jgi:hypothetical protein